MPTTETNSNSGDLDGKLLWLLFAFEALLFWSAYNREIVWYPPGNFDQAAYLVSAYRIQEDVLAHGVGKIWKAIWSPGHATGIALPIEGALSGLIMGGARFPQLFVNFVLFLVLQGVAFHAARTLWGRRNGYLLVGLILCQATAWLGAGDLFDFRIDFIAYCLYGIWACAVLRSKLFLDRRWAVACGLIGAFLVLHWFVTAVYLLVVYSGFAAVCAVIGFLAYGNVALLSPVRERLKNVGLSCAALIIVVGPILLLNGKTIWNNYVGGHFASGEEYIRASEVGSHGLSGHLLFYPKAIIGDHWAPTFLWASAIAIAGGMAARLFDRVKKNRSVSRPEEPFLSQVFFLLGAILGPTAILTVNDSKSPIAGGIVGVPAALLVVVLASAIQPKQSEFASRLSPKLLAGTAMLIFSLGVFNQLSRAGRHWPEFAARVHLRQMADFDQWLVNYASEYRWKNPTISLDLISRWLSPAAITAMGFEKTGQFVDFHGLLSTSISGPSREEALKILEDSDFVILTSPHQLGNYPFAQAVAKYWPELKAWADRHLVVAKTQRFDAYDPYTATVYVRPSAQLRDLSGDWITSKGVLVEAKRSDLERFPLVRLKGAADFSALPKLPAVTASLEPSGHSLPIAGVFRRTGGKYEIEVNTSLLPPQTDEIVHIRVKFDTFFIRKDAALHNDFRELVVRSPDVSLSPVEQ